MSARSRAASGTSPNSAATFQVSTSTGPAPIGSSSRIAAVRTVSRCRARTPATVGSTSGRSGRARVSSTPIGSPYGPPPRDPALSPPSASARTDRAGPAVRAASTASRSSSAVASVALSGGAPSPASAAAARWTRSATRVARQLLHAAGPVASASASVRACSSSRTPTVPTASVITAMVAGSSGSRRIAVSTSSRWWRTSSAKVSTSCFGNPMRAATSRVITSPASEWSPGQPLPMSCRKAATSSRSGRATRRVIAAARAAVSTRCRSTVHRCTALRCGRQRTRSQSGSRRVTRSSASSASQTGIAFSPAPSSVISCSRASSGHGTGSGLVSAARRRTVLSDNGRPACAAAAAARSGSAGSWPGRAGAASTASPSISTTPSASGRRSIGPRAAPVPKPNLRRPARVLRARSTRSTSRQVTSAA